MRTFCAGGLQKQTQLRWELHMKNRDLESRQETLVDGNINESTTNLHVATEAEIDLLSKPVHMLRKRH